jgi:hypothetical protein
VLVRQRPNVLYRAVLVADAHQPSCYLLPNWLPVDDFVDPVNEVPSPVPLEN